MYGGELSDAQRQAVQQIFGASAAAFPTETVDRAELVATLQAAGLPTDGNERAMSSALLTCAGQGSGLRVHTENITDIPAAVYASALVTGGVADATVVVAAPPGVPMTGETALIGVLRAWPRCHGGDAVSGDRLRLAYEQLRLTSGLAGAAQDWERAAATMLRATQAVTSAASADPAAVDQALDQALAADGLTAPSEWRAEASAMLVQLATIERGPYGRGYELQHIAHDDVWVRAIDR